MKILKKFAIGCLSTVGILSFQNSAAQRTVPGPQWRIVDAAKLPKVPPMGEMKDLTLSLDRQIEACSHYESGESPICRGSVPPANSRCDLDSLRRIRELAANAKSWSAFLDRAKTEFNWYELKESFAPKKMLFTAYNHPTFTGSLIRDAKFKYPIYRQPEDLVAIPGNPIQWKKKNPDGTFSPYYDRKAIDVDKVLANQGLEVAYMDDPAAILRLHIEGSGALKYKDTDGNEKQINLNFAAKNGLPYRSVFEYLRAKGVDSKYFSFAGLRQYFIDFPNDMWPTLTYNPAYVFFSASEEPPCGTARTHLVGNHSLAVDFNLMNIGSVGFLMIPRPSFSQPKPGEDPKYLARVALVQDTGSAINGAHVDIYWGESAEAETAASTLKTQGDFYWLVLKSKSSTPRK